MQVKRLYPRRRLLRALEKGWTSGERIVNRFTTVAFNPLYHLGTLSIFLLIVLAVTGLYLTVFYRPGADRAYASVARISASWLGSLMRTTHRYAADALIVVILLHALKMFLGDRFWGSRWLAWVSGWGLLVLVWLIGVMGYWLVWDQAAQWLTEYGIELLRGPVALAFLSPEIASRTFAFFVIVLFLHIFLGLIILFGVLIHELRLSRARYWAPRWLMIEASVALIVLALWRPAVSAAPADLSRLVGELTLDGWYLGFLPLTSRWGNLPFWGFATAIVGTLTLLPWLARGRDLGPAVVTNEACTGCALCFRECPYEAIEMRPNTTDPRFETIAAVNPKLCTGCGLCVGTCSTAGIELAGLPTVLVRQSLQQALEDARERGVRPLVVFTCQRHAALGSLGAWELTPVGTWASAGQEGRERPASTHALRDASPPLLLCAEWGGSNPHPAVSIVSCALPCVGMVQTEWVHKSLQDGAQAVLLLSCPADDCAFREGPRWLAQRLGRYRSLLRRGVYWLEAAPGDRGTLQAWWRSRLEKRNGEQKRAAAGKEERLPSFLPSLPSPSQTSRPLARHLAAGLVVLGLAFGLALVAERPATAAAGDQGLIRVVLQHPGKFKSATARLSEEVRAKLPSNISPEQVLGSERFPVRLRVEIDGERVLERTYQPGGLRREGQVYGLEWWSVPPGRHTVRIWMMDDGVNWRSVFSGTVDVPAGRALLLRYQEEAGTFVADASQ